MTLDSRIPSGPIADKWERRKFENKLVNPANRRKYEIIIVGTGLAGSSAAAALGEQGYRRQAVLHSRQSAPRAQHRRAGGHQRRQELSERRRQHLSPLLRHRQGWRLSRSRSERLPARAAERRHHRPVRGDRRPVCARVRRAARQPLVRRRAGVANVLRPRADRPAASARRVPVDAAAGRRRHGDAVPAPRDARPGRRRRTGARHRDAQPHYRRARAPRGAGGSALHRRLRHGLLPVDQCGELERDGGVARAQARRAVRQSVLYADSSDLHSGQWRSPVEADADVGVAAE